MLRALSIRDLVLIRAADLHFEPGLNALTGETGAGKSILLDALGFVLGWRTRGGLLREGAAGGEVIAEFVLAPGHPARAALQAAGLAAGDELILRRAVAADNRRQAWVNDRRVATETLRSLAGTLVELHGQKDDRSLLDPGRHRDLLDAFAGHEAAVEDVRAAWEAARAAEAALAAARNAQERATRDADFLAHAATELDRLDPAAGEEAELDGRRRQLRAAERIREDVARAAEAMGSDGAEGALLQAMRWLEAAAPRAEGALDPVLDGMARVLAELDETTRELDALRAKLGGDPAELEAVEERLFAIRALARKHQVASDDLPGLAGEMHARLAAIEGGAATLAGLEAEAAARQDAYAAAAGRLTQLRREAGTRLDTAMSAELKPLKLERAAFSTEIVPGPPGPWGCDRVRFLAVTNPGSPAGPIDRIASGGELSRFLLALKVCVSGRAEDATLIFDEIDRGIGGATADAVGRRLQRLGEGAQVLVVTHSPQVAARAAHHWRVGKVTARRETRTEVAALGPDARAEEIARMLAGDTITEEARAAARALLDA